MTHDFRARLLRGDQLIGTMITLPSPEAAELMAACLGRIGRADPIKPVAVAGLAHLVPAARYDHHDVAY